VKTEDQLVRALETLERIIDAAACEGIRGEDVISLLASRSVLRWALRGDNPSLTPDGKNFDDMIAGLSAAVGVRDPNEE
jgi:hypothetical protein